MQLNTGKPKLAIYWAASCGGCEIAFINLNEKILDVDANFDLVFCPCLIDTKYKDLEAMSDKGIFLTLFNGAIRTAENEHFAHCLRKKSQIMIAFGSCAYEGCIPGLGNLYSKDDIFRSVYIDNRSTVNPLGVVPTPQNKMSEGMLTIPEFYHKVKPLADVVDVDYFMPGCPPEPEQVWHVISAFLEMQKGERPLPVKRNVLGAGKSTVCDECNRTKEVKKIKRLYRTYEIIPDKDKCLLEEGIICMGIATRDGCGALCPKVNMPCTGCYGPPDGVLDQGAKMVAAIGSIIDIGDVKGLSEDEINKRIDAVIDAIPDFVGTFYKYSLPGSILGGRICRR